MLPLALSTWLASLLLFLASFVRGPGLVLEEWLFRGEFSPLFVGHIALILLAAKALSAHRLTGQTPWQFYRDKPAWAVIVQGALLGLSALLIATGPDAHVQRDLGNGDLARCVQLLDGQAMPLDAAACDALRLRALRTFMAMWATVGFISVTQFALAGRRRRSP